MKTNQEYQVGAADLEKTYGVDGHSIKAMLNFQPVHEKAIQTGRGKPQRNELSDAKVSEHPLPRAVNE
jgi:hypothetical protein